MGLVKAEFKGLKEALEKARLAALDAMAKRAKELLMEPTSYFQDHGVWVETQKNRGGVLVILQSDIAEGARVPLVYLLNFGTSVRRAALSVDWRSQTSPNSLAARPGAGTELFVGRSIQEPGILPRNWDALAAEELQKEAAGIVAESCAKTLPK